MANLTFLQLHRGKTEWAINLDHVSAIANDEDGVRIYLVGYDAPIYVDESYEQITNILKHIEI